MNFSKDKFVFTGSTGRFGRKFREKYNLTNFFYPSKKQLNIREKLLNGYNAIREKIDGRDTMTVKQPVVTEKPKTKVSIGL